MKTTTLTLLVMFLHSICTAQTFQNLDFESANVSSPTYDFGQMAQFVPVNAGLPGWVASPGYYGALYNSLLLDQPGVGVYDNGSKVGFAQGYPWPSVISGSYSALLVSSYWLGPSQTSSLTQTGLVPSNARSIWFTTTPSFFYGGSQGWQVELTLGSQAIPLAAQGVSPSGNVTWAGDITGFAGSVSELSITLRQMQAFDDSAIGLDDILFSPVIVPEPSGSVLVMMGMTLMGFMRCSSRKLFV